MLVTLFLSTSDLLFATSRQEGMTVFIPLIKDIFN